MGNVFQPKVIIGSVCGIIASTVGFIAIFFPSLFNLETKQIDELNVILNTNDDARALHDFLKHHENKVVKLEIKYTELKPYFSKWDGGYKEINESPNDVITGNSFSAFGNTKLFNIKSDFKLGLYGQSYSRENGGFGIWERHPNTTESNDQDFAFQISIPFKSNNNQLYYWNMDDKNGFNSIGTQFRLSGIFFVNPQISDNEVDNTGFMTEKYYDEKCWDRGADHCVGPDVIVLEPLNKKDIELKKY